MFGSNLSRKFRQMKRLALTAGALVFALCLVAGVDAFTANDIQFVQVKAKTDRQGDPLPDGALARMGTLRWRHAEDVAFVAFLPDGKRVLTSSQDGFIRIWDRATGKELRHIDPNTAPVKNAGIRYAYRGLSRIALSHDGKVIATGSNTNAIQLWDVETGKPLRQLKTPVGLITQIEFAPDGKSLAARSSSRVTYVMETQDGKVLHQLKGKQPKAGVVRIAGGNSTAFGLAYSPDGKVLASADLEFGQKLNTYVRITNTENGNEIRLIDATPGGVFGVAYAPDGKSVAFGTANNAIRVHDADSGKEIHNFKVPAALAGIAYSPDSKILAAKGRDGVLRLFDARTGKSMHELGTNPAALNVNVGVVFVSYGGADPRDFAFSPDGKTLAVAAGQMLRFFDVGAGKEIAQGGGSGHRGAVSAITVSADGKTMFSRGFDGTIRRWNALTGEQLNQFNEPTGTSGAIFTPDGALAALANSDGTIRLFTVADGKEIHKFKAHPNGTTALAFSPNGKILASRGANENVIRTYDVANKTELKQIALPGGNPNVRPGIVVINGRYQTAGGQAIAFSPDGQTVAINVNASSIGIINGQRQQTSSSTIHFFDVTSGKEIRQLTLPDNRAAMNLAFAPTGRVLATENVDQSISLWEIASGRERAHLTQPAVAKNPNAINSSVFIGAGGFGLNRGGPLGTATLAFSPDGSLVAARGTNDTVRVWEVAYAKEVAGFKGHTGAVQSLAFAPDGKSLASGSVDTTILVWDLAKVSRTQLKAGAIAAQQLDAIWVDLAGNDGVKAGQHLIKLASAPKQAAAYFAERLKPAAPPDVEKIDKWIMDLDSGNFKLRAIAAQELEKLGELAMPALKKVLAGQPTLETRRRIEPMVEKLTTGVLTNEQIRVTRAIEVLETIATPEARRVLETLAQGAPGALQTRQAQDALQRMMGRTASR